MCVHAEGAQTCTLVSQQLQQLVWLQRVAVTRKRFACSSTAVRCAPQALLSAPPQGRGLPVLLAVPSAIESQSVVRLCMGC